MHSKVFSATTIGISAYLVDVEADLFVGCGGGEAWLEPFLFQFDVSVEGAVRMVSLLQPIGQRDG